MISVHGTEPSAFVLFVPCAYSPVRQELRCRRVCLSRGKRLLASSCSSLCPSVRMYYHQLCPPLDGFAPYLDICREVPDLVKIRQKCRSILHEGLSVFNCGRRHYIAIKEASSSKRVYQAVTIAEEV